MGVGTGIQVALRHVTIRPNVCQRHLLKQFPITKSRSNFIFVAELFAFVDGFGGVEGFIKFCNKSWWVYPWLGWARHCYLDSRRSINSKYIPTFSCCSS